MGSRNRLSVTKIRTLEKSGAYADGNGLYLQVRNSGNSASKSWIFRYMRNGKAHNMGLGSIHVVTLAEARIGANDAQRQLHHGVDPLAEKKKQRAKSFALSFKEGAAKYIEIHRPTWKNPKHANQWSNTLRDYAEPVIGTLGMDEIAREHLIRILKPIWLTKAETASRVRGRIEKILDWASVEGLRTGDNPAKWRGNLEHSLPSRVATQKIVHHSAMPYAKVPAFYKRLIKEDGMAALALRFLILTAARTGEVRFATPEEFDLNAKVWTVPAARMKAGKEHRVPLSDPALDLVRQCLSQSEYVFSPFPAKAMSENAMLALLKRMNVSGVTVHGFRSSFRDWAAEKSGSAREVIEGALAHSNPDQVEAAYLRTDLLAKRSLLMNAWSTHCSS